MIKQKISDGVTGTFVENRRFKNNLITVSFMIKPEKTELPAMSLVTTLMAEGCEKYPNFTLLNRKLDLLYGADIIKSDAVCGDFRIYSLSVKTVDDKFSENGNLLQSAELLSDLCFEYYLNGVSYKDEDLEREKRVLAEKVAASLNNKRVYATEKLKSIMCKDEPFGLPVSGTVDEIKSVSKKDIENAQKRLMQNAFIDIQFTGGSLPDGLFDIFGKKLKLIKRNPTTDFTQIVKSAEPEREASEKMAVSQGKLLLGFRSNNKRTVSQSAADLLMSDIFGGGPYSKLFTVVREKMSLCYYCSSSVNRFKGIMTVSSGVEKDNIEKAKEEILNQLSLMKKGEFSDETIADSKRAIIGSLKSVGDDIGATARWYQNRLTETALSPEEYIEEIKNVTREDIIASAKSFELDTVFVLSPETEEK